MSVDVSFRTGNYADYNNTQYTPGCIYYLTEYTDPTDETSEIVGTHIFLNGVEYGSTSSAIDAMAKFGTYTASTYSGITTGRIVPDADKLIISNLQTNTTPTQSRDVVPKSYVDGHLGDVYKIYSSTSGNQVANILSAYLNSSNLSEVYYIYTKDNDVHTLTLTNYIMYYNSNQMHFYFNEISSTNINRFDASAVVIQTSVSGGGGGSPYVLSYIGRYNYNYLSNSPIIDDNQLYDYLLANIGQIKTYVSSKVSQWESI